MNVLKKNRLAFCLLYTLLGFCSQAISASQGWGRVNMQGAILDTACAIATESREQTVDMKNISISDIENREGGNRVPFSIELVNCVLEREDKKLPDWRQFSITFDGHAEGEMFGVRGNISGVALRITDAFGNIARPGEPMLPVDIFPGNNRLDFYMALIANNQPIKAGSYSSSVRFKMDYY